MVPTPRPLIVEAHTPVQAPRSPAEPPGGCLIIASTSIGAAERYAEAHFIHPTEIVTRRDLRRARSLRQLVRERGIRRAIAHSVDWSRQGLPQLYETALLLAPVKERYVADDRRGTTTRVDHGDTLRLAVRLPIDGIAAGWSVAAESLRFAATRRRRVSSFVPPPPERAAVMAMWLGALESPVGGSITHISGMLAGFKQLGLRVGLVTSVDPPEQLAQVIDDAEITRPLSRGERVISDVSRLADNRAVREAGSALADRLRPAFLYQRHRAFLVAGADVALRNRIPLVLEWNASEVWCRANWENTLPPLQLLDPLLASMERDVVRAAARIVAVSTHAADMALDVGADSADVLVVPNAAPVARIRELIRDIPARGDTRPLIGWIGSFGVWHGAHVLIEALACLDGVELLMIGDGPQRQACRQLSARLGLTNRIEWAGALPHDEAVRRLARCDVLASPHVPLDGQRFFGSPTKLFEYMAIGRPIVASNLEQLGEVLDHGRTALLVEPDNVRALAAGLSEMLSMPARGAALGAAAQREAGERHDWLHRARAVLDAIGCTEPATR